MRVTIWGARGSVPVSGPRYDCFGGDTTCVSVSANQPKTFILDAGTGIRALNQVGHTELYLLLTHLHWDHIQGLPFFVPLYDAEKNITIYGKANGQSVQKSLEDQQDFVHFPVPLQKLSGIKSIQEFYPGEEIYNDGEMCIDTLLQNHTSGGSIGYRFREQQANGDYTTFVFSTDLELEGTWLDDRVAEFWHKADLVIADMQYEPPASENPYHLFKPGWGHSDYQRSIQIATLAEVKQIVGTHFDPSATDDYLSELEFRMQSGIEHAAERMGKPKIEAELARPTATYLL